MPLEDAYERAEQFLPDNSEDLVLNDEVDVNWIDEDDRFWYRRERHDGAEFELIDLEADERTAAFDHDRVATALQDETGASYDSSELPFEEFEYVDDESSIRFTVEETRYECNLSTYEVEPVSEDPAGVSPDGRWVAFVEDHDLYVRDTGSSEVIQLTDDGTDDYGYATPPPSPVDMIEEGAQEVDPSVEITWSSDSRRFMTYQLDQRSASEFALVQSSPDEARRPAHYTYAYPLPGEVGVPVAEPVVFDVERRTKTELDVDPIPLLYFGHGPLFEWYEDDERLHHVHRSRGHDVARVLEIDATTGEARVLHEEESDTLVDPAMSGAHLVDGGDELIWSSERSGWHHLYRLDGETGEVVNQITGGDWVVREVRHIDEESRQIYFTASGREQGRDPYLRHLYRVGFDGSQLTLLTPEPLDHEIDVSPSGDYFVDSRSRVDSPTESVVRESSEGAEVRTIVTADDDELQATGWTAPEPFEAVGADGETAIYGVVWRPSDFDPAEAYPVVEQIYTGPHDFHVPKRFSAYRSSAQSIAELGFVVVMIDGRGTGRRSKAFRDASYENLSRAGIEDHVAAIRQLDEDYSYLDLSAVGIYGHSAGGYDAAHALLQRSDFYDAAVSSGGNHDHRLDKASWNEMWMGYPVGDHYHEQSNVTLADQLEGDLLLMHGELDQNVHPAATLRFTNALMEANKDFNMYLIPNAHHDLSSHAYFHRQRWDHFVGNLRDATPPDEYEIESYH